MAEVGVEQTILLFALATNNLPFFQVSVDHST